MLDNAIWAALTTRQAHFALGNEQARRFPADMAPFIAAERPEHTASLAELAWIPMAPFRPNKIAINNMNV
jgi:hypothetical protein